MYSCVKTSNQPDDKSAIGLIAAEIDDAVKSAAKKWFVLTQFSAERGRILMRACYEDAAKIAEETNEGWQEEEHSVIVAAAIRAKAKGIT